MHSWLACSSLPILCVCAGYTPSQCACSIFQLHNETGAARKATLMLFHPDNTLIAGTT